MSDSSKKRNARWVKRMIATGRCPRCGKALPPQEKRICDICSETRNIWQRNSYRPVPRRKIQNLRSPELVAQAIDLYEAGRTLTEAGRKLGVCAVTIENWLKKEGIKRRPRYGQKSKG